MRIAVLADTHGNVIALEAVLADIARHRPDLIVDLGDCVSGPLWPRDTLECLKGVGALTVRGNHDRQVSTLAADAMGPSDRFAHDELEARHLDYLRSLPSRLEIAPGVLAFHATPERDDRYLLEDVVDGRLVRSTTASVARRLGAATARVILCGHSHRADMLRLDNGSVVLNPGSVGCPAYDDSAHVSESGTPHARYALLSILPTGDVNVEFKALSYRHESAAARAEANGRPEWAYALRTGLMPPAAS